MNHPRLDEGRGRRNDLPPAGRVSQCGNTMRIFRVFGLGVGLALTTLTAHAQSVQQSMFFSILANYQSVGTNVISAGVTNYHLVLHHILINKNNVVKAIALDFAGTNWGRWENASLLRRINLETGAEAMYLSKGGTNEANVSSFFGNSNFLDGFMANVPPVLTSISNAVTNFVMPNPIYSGWTTNGNVNGTNYLSRAGLFYLSLNTSNMVLNLVGSSLFGDNNGVIQDFQTVGTNVEGPLRISSEEITVVGASYVNVQTNYFIVDGSLNLTNGAFVSGPAVGTVAILPAVRSLVSEP